MPPCGSRAERGTVSVLAMGWDGFMRVADAGGGRALQRTLRD